LWQVGSFLQEFCFLHQWKWPPQYNWNIVESGVRHHKAKPNPVWHNEGEFLSFMLWNPRWPTLYFCIRWYWNYITRLANLIEHKLYTGWTFPNWGHPCHDHMVIGFTTTCAISAYDHYVIKFVIDLQQVSGLLRILWFPPRYNWNIVERGVKHHDTPSFSNLTLCAVEIQDGHAII
jgi:hypothetical protein